MIVHDDLKFIYVDIPKTGSLTLDTIFKDIGGTVLTNKHNNTLKHSRIILEQHKDYMVIASVRNPYDRALSYYHYSYNRGTTNAQTFGQYLTGLRNLEKYKSDTLVFREYQMFPLHRYLSVFPHIDYVIHLEYINNDLKQLPFDVGDYIPHKNSTKHPPFDYKNKKAIAEINRWAGQDFEMFGYERL